MRVSRLVTTCLGPTTATRWGGAAWPRKSTLFIATVAACIGSGLVELSAALSREAWALTSESRVATAQSDAAGAKPAVSVEEVVEFLAYVERNTRWPLGNGSPVRRDDEGRIVELSLREFKLRPGDARKIGALTDLTNLNLAYSNVANGDVLELATLSKLRRLRLWGTKVGDQGLAALGQLKSLESLELGGTAASDKSLVVLASLKKLRSLDLARTKVTDQGMTSLLGLEQLETLKLSETAVTDAGLDALARHVRLRNVTLDETRVTPEGLARWGKLAGRAWMVSDEALVEELAQRMVVGDPDQIDGLLSVGLDLPSRGPFRVRSIRTHDETDRDRERQRRRFRIEWHWRNMGRDEGLFAEVSVRQRSLRVIEVGLLE